MVAPENLDLVVQVRVLAGQLRIIKVFRQDSKRALLIKSDEQEDLD